MLYIILFLISIAGGYVAFRYISLLRALKQIQKELDVIQQDLSKNQMIHLPVPNNRLKELLITINIKNPSLPISHKTLSFQIH